MPKINVGVLPPITPEVGGPYIFTVPDQGEFSFYLREPDYPTALQIEGDAESLVARFIAGKEFPRYPVPFYLPVSPLLCRQVAMLQALLCDASGKKLRGEDAYGEGELFVLSSKQASIFYPLAIEAQKLWDQMDANLGNGLGAPADNSGETPFTTESSPTPTSSTTSSEESTAS